jgi:hypothetical protein
MRLLKGLALSMGQYITSLGATWSNMRVRYQLLFFGNLKICVHILYEPAFKIL